MCSDLQWKRHQWNRLPHQLIYLLDRYDSLSINYNFKELSFKYGISLYNVGNQLESIMNGHKIPPIAWLWFIIKIWFYLLVPLAWLGSIIRNMFRIFDLLLESETYIYVCIYVSARILWSRASLKKTLVVQMRSNH